LKKLEAFFPPLWENFIGLTKSCCRFFIAKEKRRCVSHGEEKALFNVQRDQLYIHFSNISVLYHQCTLFERKIQTLKTFELDLDLLTRNSRLRISNENL